MMQPCDLLSKFPHYVDVRSAKTSAKSSTAKASVFLWLLFGLAISLPPRTLCSSNALAGGSDHAPTASTIGITATGGAAPKLSLNRGNPLVDLRKLLLIAHQGCVEECGVRHRQPL